MNESFSIALELLAVGMITVFTILALIVILGNLLTTVVNKFFPEPAAPQVAKASIPHAIDGRKMAAIVAAVDIVTEGKAKVTSITNI
ncbi:MAG: OadG family protein [Cyclobacteriaceae bacterium]|nr:OadG family protein [Cyclobacteriaceae bacterium]